MKTIGKCVKAAIGLEVKKKKKSLGLPLSGIKVLWPDSKMFLHISLYVCVFLYPYTIASLIFSQGWAERQCVTPNYNSDA